MLDLLAIGDISEDTFLELHEGTVQCDVNREHCQMLLPYGSKIPVTGVTKVLASGNAANHAVAAAHLGLKVAMVSTVGDDSVGKNTIQALKQYGVKTNDVRVEPGTMTNVSTIIHFQGERTILVYHAPRSYRFPRAPKAKYVFFSSVGGNHEAYTQSLLEYIEESSAKLVFSPGTHQLRLGLPALTPLFKVAAMSFMNKEEAETLVGEKKDMKSLLQALVKYCGGVLCITDGEKGSYAVLQNDYWFCPVFPATALERTGSGDAFAAGFVAAVYYGREVKEALQWGSVNAAGVIRHVGSHEGLLTKKEIETVLKKYPEYSPRVL